MAYTTTINGITRPVLRRIFALILGNSFEDFFVDEDRKVLTIFVEGEDVSIMAAWEENLNRALGGRFTYVINDVSNPGINETKTAEEPKIQVPEKTYPQTRF